MRKDNINIYEKTYLDTCKDIMQDPEFTQTHHRQGAIEFFTGSGKEISYVITVDHISATQFDIYIKYNISPRLYTFYNRDASSPLFALITLLKDYEIYGAPRKTLLSRILHRNK